MSRWGGFKKKHLNKTLNDAFPFNLWHLYVSFSWLNKQSHDSGRRLNVDTPLLCLCEAQIIKILSFVFSESLFWVWAGRQWWWFTGEVKCAHQYSLLNTQTVTSSCNNDSFPLDFSFFYNKCINKPEHSVQGPNLICDFRTGSFFMLN